ncbi:helix-turn-helix domain-containing protein [Azospirillum thermophilum]|nr:helix-turn-helix transcriptional regulator [Azospirillum thermophilum]
MTSTVLPPHHPLEIGRRLHATRLGLNLKSTEIAEAIGITTQAWSQYEAGSRRASLDVGLALSNRFRIPLDWIYRGELASVPYSLAQEIMRHMAGDQA